MFENTQYLERSSPFSFVCAQDCSDCCKHKLIQVNPYEITRMSSCLHITTSEFIHAYTQQGVYLKQYEDGACIFHSEEGCSVHPDRPLVCRLYPLGAHQNKEKNEQFTLVQLPSFCEGVLDTKGTVESYLNSQDTKDYFNASNQYSVLLEKVIDSLNKVYNSQIDTSLPEWYSVSNDEGYPKILDIDYVLKSTSINTKALDAKEKMNLHIAIIEESLKTINTGE